MACSVTINTPPTGDTVANKIVDIVLSGTASVPDCDSVDVTLNCSGFPSTAQGVPVDAAGNWTVVFKSPADPQALDPLANCGCGQPVTVHVQCKKGGAGVPSQPVAGCDANWSGALNCEPACPDINWLLPTPDPKCNPDDTRNVSNLGAVVTNPALPVIQAQLEWVEGGLVLDAPPPAAGQVNLGPVTHPFASGPQHLHVTVSSPPGCGGSESPEFIVNPCGPVGACCFKQAGTPAMICEEMTAAECQAKNGDYQGDGTTCDKVDCGSTPPITPPGKPVCGDALVYMAALAAAIALLLLGIWKCLPPQAQAFAIATIVGFFFLSTLLMFIWGLSSFFNKCKLDWCKAAKIWISALTVTSVILAILNPVLNICCGKCFFTIVWWVIAGMGLPWAVVVSTQCTSKP